MDAAAAARHAGLHHRLCLHGRPRLRRTRPERASRALRLGPGGLLVPGHPQPAGGEPDADPRALPLRLHPRPRRLPRPVDLRAGSRPHARCQSLGGLPARRPAHGAARHRGGRGAGADGGARRFRHGAVFRRHHLHHDDLPDLVRARRPRRGEPARDRASRLRAPAGGDGVPRPARAALRRRGRGGTGRWRRCSSQRRRRRRLSPPAPCPSCSASSCRSSR